jgi:hypothetical protein
MFNVAFQLSTSTLLGPPGVTRTISRPPFSHVPLAFYPYPTGNVGYGYYNRVRFGDMANAFFAITFAEDGGQLHPSFR